MSLDGVKLGLVDSIDDVLSLASWLGERRPYHALAVDTETTGLVIGVDRVRLVQVGDGDRGWAIPWETWGGLFHDIARRWDGDWIMHNSKFDYGMLKHMGTELPTDRIRDTRIMTQILTPHYSTALKPTAARLVDAKAASLQTDLKASGWDWATVPIDYRPYWSYAALDTVLTARLHDILYPQVMEAAPKAYEIESAVTWVIAKMERYGAHINIEFAQRKYTDFTEFVRSAEQWCVDNYNVKPGSNAAVVKILQEAGYEFTKATASGAVALDKEVLGSIDHPLAQTVLQRRQLQKLASTYLAHFVSETDENDCIHPSINTLGARTSRMSMERPNLQNLPRKSERNPAADSIRQCIDSRYGRDGSMLMCDFDQVEMRLMADMSREPTMTAAFKDSSVDFFVALARLVYADDTIIKSDPRRQVIKNAGYATIYGAGVEKFSKTAGISVEQGQWVRQRWNDLYPAVSRFQKMVQDIALERRVREGLPYVFCPVTKRRQVADPGKEYSLVNFLIQGAAAAVLKMKLIELDSAGLGDWMVVPVHDEIILDVPNEYVDDAADTLRRVMNDDKLFTVPLSASVSYGPSWGSKEAYAHRS